MKETPLSNCERDFLLKVILKKKRIDDRGAYDFRRIKVQFGLDYGCCYVELGNTKVMAQVTCNLVEPKHSRPNEGQLIISLELSPMASASFESGRLSRKGIQMNRLLERCLKESHCVDMESLCVIAEQQVWEIRVDVHVLNHDGNILDACGIAAIAALSHFRRPDISVDDGKITVHPAEEKASIPLTILHMPVCCSFSFFHQGNYLLLDATRQEERVSEGVMVIAMNKHRELCALHMDGTHLLHKDQVARCTNITAAKVLQITELIHEALANDVTVREAGGSGGYAESEIQVDVTSLTEQEVNEDEMDEEMELTSDIEKEYEDMFPEDDIKQTAAEVENSKGDKIGQGLASSWQIDTKPADDEKKISKNLAKKPKRAETITISDDSEEDEVVTLENLKDG